MYEYTQTTSSRKIPKIDWKKQSSSSYLTLEMMYKNCMKLDWDSVSSNHHVVDTYMVITNPSLPWSVDGLLKNEKIRRQSDKLLSNPTFVKRMMYVSRFLKKDEEYIP